MPLSENRFPLFRDMRLSRVDELAAKETQQAPPSGRERGIKCSRPWRGPDEPQQKPARAARGLSDLGELAGGVGAKVHDPVDRDHHAVVDRPAGGGMLGDSAGLVRASISAISPRPRSLVAAT